MDSPSLSEASRLLSEIEMTPVSSAQEAENFRLKYLSKKGLVVMLFDELKRTQGEEKKRLGKALNDLKQAADAKYKQMQNALRQSAQKEEAVPDLTLPGTGYKTGSRHPISIVRKDVLKIFQRIGFTISYGPEIEDDWHNFTALNFPPDHPARDMQDTFFIEKGTDGEDVALRTHTSSVQIRLMENGKPPFRSLMPGRVYRNEAISARAGVFFHQVEGLYVDRGVSFADLKQTLFYFVQEMYGKSADVRLRPSYFPFTEPSAEMDVSCMTCEGKGCPVCKYSGWVEILGCGMIDPAVLTNCGIDADEFTGFAFGMGIDRLALNRYKTGDLRIFFENDVQFLSQFTSF